MSVNNEVYQIDANHALHVVIDIVFKYLKAKDLSNMAKVCKSWREAALREKSLRYYDQQLRFPYDIDNLGNKLDITPYVSLLIYNPALEKSLSLPKNFCLSDSIGIGEELLKHFKAKLPNKMIVLRVDMYLSTEDVDQVENVQRDVKLVDNCEILGLFFPSIEGRLRVDVAWVDLEMNESRCHDPKYKDQFFNRNSEVNRFAKELGLRSCEYPKTTILLLTDGSNTEVLKQLRKRPKRDGQRIIWAGIFSNMLRAGNHHHGDNDPDRFNWQSSVALRFSGPSVDSCSTFIYIHASRDEIERKLHKLKEQVKRKRHYIGLLYSINCVRRRCAHFYHPCCNSREMMYNLKISFPDIRFKGFYKNVKLEDVENLYASFPDRSNVNHAFDEELLKKLHCYTSIIIISYD